MLCTYIQREGDTNFLRSSNMSTTVNTHQNICVLSLFIEYYIFFYTQKSFYSRINVNYVRIFVYIVDSVSNIFSECLSVIKRTTIVDLH